ncbi:Thioesterase/thiol ester dehydrase-isomerase [Piedraia hortae CBS 480.64]|uniref:Thioesterase/thiol ester dehydrase-isomerase n=1 Tax=Piedraia hortae CBS 480.64 TaxID=1314780 RepID=A0A6A7BYM2_9PEZI|nr:Thioesterase/thiol ester dehydrase-isomerase [Piedraia hortae CBS 480.64]
MEKRTTLIRPPPPSDHRAPIEEALALTRLEDIDPNLFTNTRPLWHPPGARGIYGGAAIAQCLAAAQRTVPEGFLVHSMHCYFVLNGNSEIPVIYHVEHVREGRSYATRTVQARQRGQAIFTTTISFQREGSGGKQTLFHAATMPADVVPPTDISQLRDPSGLSQPFISIPAPSANPDSAHHHEKRMRQWIKARGRISDEGGRAAHTTALAYMSDSYFIGTVSRAHRLRRFDPRMADSGQVARLLKMSDQELREQARLNDEDIQHLRAIKLDEEGYPVQEENVELGPQVGMMVSLDHTIYFHSPSDFRADEWLLAECDSPWAGDGRGLVHQRMYTQTGKLVATCVQEGLVRLKQDGAKL